MRDCSLPVAKRYFHLYWPRAKKGISYFPPSFTIRDFSSHSTVVFWCLVCLGFFFLKKRQKTEIGAKGMKHRQESDLWCGAIPKGMKRNDWLLQHLHLSSRSERTLLVATWLSYYSFGMHWKRVKVGTGWEWGLGGRKTEFVKGKGQHGKQLFRNEVTIMQCIPFFEVFKAFSVRSTCNILCSCEMPVYVLQRSCGSLDNL